MFPHIAPWLCCAGGEALGAHICALSPSYRVAEKEPINKMSLHNLATVFGPTLLRPSEGESKGHLTLASDIWSHDVMAQVRAELAVQGPLKVFPCLSSLGIAATGHAGSTLLFSLTPPVCPL